ncbi:hypothetical protein ACFQVC_32875 [Streptomyces monticola]|uniref:Helix-turn-helix domain-containing protein n=1 Tax=Streptomyces monticola TaxID=2666263 RepID=A0ABW2JU87_9ACTN
MVMTGFGAGIRRGSMAADHFTQISNTLFRDPRLTFKAKGIFGLISTHRDGWTVTVAELARHGREERGAITRGLQELEEYGYLSRHRARRADGTLGESVYAITDLPAHLHALDGSATPAKAETRRSQPKSQNPALDNPALENAHTKNTKRKNTKKQKTRDVLPSVPPAPARENDQAGRPTDRPGMTAGVQLLLAIGAKRPELLLTGQALHDQGAVATALLGHGWTREQLEHVIAGRPLPDPIRTSVGAIIAARLRTAQATVPPDIAAGRIGHRHERCDEQQEPAGTIDRPVNDALAYRALVECAGCGAPGPAPGEDLCPACLNWPSCTACTGPSPRRAHPEGDGRCTVCAERFP